MTQQSFFRGQLPGVVGSRPLLLLLLLLLLTNRTSAQGCTVGNAIYLEEPSAYNISLAACQLGCKQNLSCTYFTWNSQLQACGYQSFAFGGVLDLAGQYSGSPLSGALQNKLFVGVVLRSNLSIQDCATYCGPATYYQEPYSLCQSWTWYSYSVVNNSSFCILLFEQPTNLVPVSVTSTGQLSPTTTSVATSLSMPKIYSGVKACQEVNHACTRFVAQQTCCSDTLPFVPNCYSDQSGTSGIVQSPNYPFPYGNGRACIWNITAPPQATISITITSLQTEPNDRLFVLRNIYSCTEDPPYNCNDCSPANLTYFSGNSNSLTLPYSFDIPDNKAAIYFYSDASVSQAGFTLTWVANFNQDCGTRVKRYPLFVKNCGADQTGTSGTIVSPNHPQAYGNNSQCKWAITAPAGSMLLLQINAFNTEANADRLFILYPQNCTTVVDKELSGGHSQQTIVVPQNKVLLYFVSNNNISSSGFSIAWSAAPTCSSYISSIIPSQKFSKNCGGGSVSGSSGSITSPNYPNSYGNNNNCEWSITSSTNNNINITITAFNMEAPYDRLVILDSVTCAQVVPYLTGSTFVPQTITTGRKKVTILFYSDGSIVSTGFNMTWKAV